MTLCILQPESLELNPGLGKYGVLHRMKAGCDWKQKSPGFFFSFFFVCLFVWFWFGFFFSSRSLESSWVAFFLIAALPMSLSYEDKDNFVLPHPKLPVWCLEELFYNQQCQWAHFDTLSLMVTAQSPAQVLTKMTNPIQPLHPDGMQIGSCRHEPPWHGIMQPATAGGIQDLIDKASASH